MRWCLLFIEVYFASSVLHLTFLACLFTLITVCPLRQMAYNEALKKHGSVSVDVAQCIFVGASAAVKSTLKHLLVHNTPKAVKTSTVVVEKPVVVTVSSQQYTVQETTSAWRLVNSDVMWRSLQACVNAKAYDKDQYSEPLRHQNDQHQQLEEQMGSPNPPTSLNLIQKFIRFSVPLLVCQTFSETIDRAGKVPR